MRRAFLKSKYFHLGLFLLTLLTTTAAGAEFMTGKSMFWGPEKVSLNQFLNGLQYSLPFLLILSAHEFGHYFAAKYHHVKATLPYYIPFYLGFIPVFAGSSGIGTFGAVIRIKSLVKSRTIFFDVGIAGPLAGFIVALGVLAYGFTHLPPKEHIFTIHPDYKQYGLNYESFVYDPKILKNKDSIAFENALIEDSLQYVKKNKEERKEKWERIPYPGFRAEVLTIGDNLIFYFFKKYIAPDPALIPNKFEIMHYPLLLVGYLALFFTALNLIPVGQLDGGHILYGLIGSKNHKTASAIIFTGLVFYGGLGVVTLETILTWLDKIAQNPEEVIFDALPLYYLLYLLFVFAKVTDNRKSNILLAISVFSLQYLVTYFYPTIQGNIFWLVYGFMLSRVLGLYHPPTIDENPLNNKRKVLGWITLIIFILSFSPEPFVVLEIK